MLYQRPIQAYVYILSIALMSCVLDLSPYNTSFPTFVRHYNAEIYVHSLTGQVLLFASIATSARPGLHARITNPEIPSQSPPPEQLTPFFDATTRVTLVSLKICGHALT
ncbi:hypothetical protein EJ05DRAFT_172135 [Pseudovirgaria hyperparasitica]|uniref:Uncharacterized protein n=1 Tax=Pseudovirgaria hyperparasitica TaxID=470096 RepID=A0A6A6VUH2_9PEZI|nr:uncharacterized protein EJ05DRAFT_172135 [Pseudovirgaria hyperparasitica]KAF2753805.1 hypothetical protein EJ05DRAFT_172135 [Pseudovirgaria hyperparasitica]